MQAYKSDPLVKQIGFENLKKNVSFIYPDEYPAIRGIFCYGKKLCVKSSKKQGDKEEYIIMDFKGTELRRLYMPSLTKASVIEQMNGIDKQFYSIYKNRFYSLIENEDEEVWELHAVLLKK
ncbi:MAG: hypothetical protein GY757_45000 [bacterium]|nr:hypothetical protein [bacterium]